MLFNKALDSEDLAPDRELSTTVFRIFQEALTNVARHANASRVEANLTQKGDKLELEIKDNGKGITQEQISHPKSFGLIGMRERVRSLGGEFGVKGTQNKGTTVTVSVPLLEPVGHRPLSTPRLVGREKEMRRLRSLLEKADQEEGKLVLIHGEAGIGKTRLVTELAQDLETRGGRVLFGGCHEDTRSISYYPFREAFNRYLDTVGVQFIEPIFSSLPDYSRWELARIVPGFEGPEPSQFEPAKDHFRLFEAFRLFIQHLATRSKGSLLVIVEDLDLSGDATFDLLHYLARNLARSRVLLCATYRTEEAEESLHRFTDSVQKEKLAEGLTLQSLSSHDVSTMIDLLCPGVDTPREFRDYLYQKTEGNPFFVEELVKLLPEAEVTGGLTRLKEVPQSIQAVLKRRVSSLESRVREILSCAAVVGEEFEFEVLRGALDRPEMEVMEAVEAGARAHIVRESMRGEEERYCFIHALMADVLYSGIGRVRRRLWHGQVGEALEQVYGGSSLSASGGNGRLTYHFELGENWEKACEYALRSARQAKEMYANDDGILACQRALDDYDRIDAKTQIGLRDTFVDIQFTLGELMQRSGRYDDAISCYRKMRDAAKLAGRKAAEAKALGSMGFVCRLTSSMDEGLKWYGKSLAIAKEMGDEKHIAECLNGIGAIHQWKGLTDEALTYHEESLVLSKETENKKGISQGLSNIGGIHIDRGEYENALTCLTAALAIDREIGDKEATATDLNRMGMLQRMRGLYDEALTYFEDSLKISRETGDKRRVATGLNNIAVMYGIRSLEDEALKYYEEALTMFREMGVKGAVANTLRAIGGIHIERAEYSEALQSDEEVMAINREMGNKRGILLGHSGRGIMKRMLGFCDEAAEVHNRMLSIAREIDYREGEFIELMQLGLDLLALQRPHDASVKLTEALAMCTDPRLQAKVLDGLAEAHIGLGNFKEASEAIDRMKSIGEEINSTTTVAAAHMHEARCLPPLEALPRAEKALTMSEEVRSPEMIWRAHQVLGRILKEKGDLTNATSHYHQARATVESIAEKLSDPKVRQRYLNKPEHKELFAECERLRADSRA